MPRLGARLAFSVAAMCVPTLVVAALCVLFLVRDVPKIVREEKERVAANSEKAAKEMRSAPEKADVVWVRGKGVVSGVPDAGASYPADMSWKDWRPESGTKRRDMWGWRPAEGGGRVVWVRGLGKADGTVYLRKVDIEARDWAFTFYLFVPLFLFVLFVATFVGARYFVEYAKARDDFMKATAHDLATPLVAMRNLIGFDDGETRNLNERLIRIVGNVKDFLLLGGRRKPPERAPFDLVAAYREAYALFREDYRDLFGGEDVELDLSAFGEEGARPKALGDETMAVQILWNLLGNDLKYAAPFGRVKVAFSLEGGFAKVEFVDEGKGMTRGEMARAFDRYYRAKTILVSGKGGFGIGLCTSREFAEAMGGTLSVRANSPTGCIFTLRLPSAARQ